MDVDIRTIVLIIGVFRLIMLLVFLYQLRAAKSVSGPGWWLLWTVAAVLGSIVILIRNLPGVLPFAIVLQNPLIAVETTFIFIGLLAFFEIKPRLRIFLFAYAFYYLLHLFFYVGYNDANIRTLLLYAFMAINTFLSALYIFKNKNVSISLTANVNTIILIVHGLIYSFRVLMIISGIHSPSMFEKSSLNYLFYFDDLIIGILLAFGLIIMINQKLNAEINETKTHFEKIFDTTPDSVIISRLDDGKLVDCNERFLEFTGFTKELLPGTTDIIRRMLADPDDADRMLVILKNEGFFEDKEIQYKRPDGTAGSCLVNAVTIQLKGVPHAIGLIHDITSRKRAEDQINIMNEILKRSNAEKDKLFSIIAHDLISPFNGFLGLTEVMTDEDQVASMDGMRAHAKTVHNIASNMFKLLNNLLEWSRLEQGLIPFNPEKLQLMPVIYESMETVSEQARHKRISISYNIPSDATVTFDKNAFKSVIRNLVSNAIKFTPSGGRIEISAKKEGLDLTCISVRDNGIGMSQEMVSKIFHIDAKTNRKGTDGEMSTGLGLLICRDFVERGNGKLRATSKENVGSEFFFTIQS